MFFKYLDKIRKFEYKNKKLLAFSLSLFITGLIFVFWVVFWFPLNTGRQKLKNKSIEKEFSVYSDFKNKIIEIKNTNFSGTVEYSRPK